MSAEAVLTCDCGRSITVPLRGDGPGNDPRVDLPDEWRMWFVDAEVIVECPTHAAAGLGGKP
jgi:hypothetical protein